MPDNTRAVIDGNSWQRPAIFDWLQEKGNVEDQEMFRTFNCGIGMAMVIDQSDVQSCLDHFAKQDIEAMQIGEIAQGEGAPEVIINT